MAKKTINRTRYPLEDNVKRALFIRPGAPGAPTPFEIPYATRTETDAGVLLDKVLNPDVGAYAYDRLRHVGQHAAGKGTATHSVSAIDGTIPIDCSESNVFRTTLTGNALLGNPTGGIRGQVINILVGQDTVGGHDLTFGDRYLWVLGVTPTVSSGAGAIDLISGQFSEALNAWLCTYLPDFTGTGTGYGQFAVGPEGPQGPTGPQGEPGVSGITAGGTDGQVLTKLSATDGDADWETPRYVPLAGTTGQVLAKASDTDNDLVWADAGGGGSSYLDGLLDVDVYAPVDGDVLTWDSALGLWISAAPTGGSGDVATDAIWDAAGDLAVGSGANTAARLAVGTEGQVLTVVSGSPAWASPGIGQTETKLQASTLSVTSNTTLQDTSLVSGTLAAGTYSVEFNISFTSHATPDTKISLNFTGTATSALGNYIRARAYAAVGGEIITALPYDVTATTTDTTTWVGSMVVVVSASGQLRFQIAQNTSSATGVSFNAGSVMRVTRVA